MFIVIYKQLHLNNSSDFENVLVLAQPFFAWGCDRWAWRSDLTCFVASWGDSGKPPTGHTHTHTHWRCHLQCRWNACHLNAKLFDESLTKTYLMAEIFTRISGYQAKLIFVLVVCGQNWRVTENCYWFLFLIKKIAASLCSLEFHNGRPFTQSLNHALIYLSVLFQVNNCW